MSTKDSHCSYCGHPYKKLEWPRCCANCHNVSFRNPIPVAVVVQPIDDGILLIRRAIEPQIGKWALPGGYVDFGESWQEGAVREMEEEAGLHIEPEQMSLIGVLPSSNRVTMLVFGEAPALTAAAVAGFEPNEEVSGIMVCKSQELASVDFAFSLHREVAQRWFEP